MKDTNEQVSARPVVLLAEATGALWAALLMLWLGTAPWTDYASFALLAVSACLFVLAGFAWMDEDRGRRDSK